MKNKKTETMQNFLEKEKEKEEFEYKLSKFK